MVWLTTVQPWSRSQPERQLEIRIHVSRSSRDEWNVVQQPKALTSAAAAAIVAP